jgi:dihydropteroate synthase
VTAAGEGAEFCPWAGEPAVRFALRPLGLSDGAGDGLELAGGPLRFSRLELAFRRRPGDRVVRAAMATDAALRWAKARGVAGFAARLDALSRPRSPFGGLSVDRPLVMGIVNVTPDSFSDGGDTFAHDAAIAHGRAMRAAGADLLDIGGESTRPGAEPVPAAEELRRVLPVVSALAAEGALISIDTRHAAVMQATLAAGAGIVNDVTALAGDADSLAVVRDARCPVILMHMRGDPQTMQDDPRYADAPMDVHDYLADRVEACVEAGIPRADIAIDPGIGFGKTLAHNLELMRHLAVLHDIGCPILLGVSRKRFIGGVGGGEQPKDRLPGSIAAALAGLDRGVQMIRVHDVAETMQARAIWSALNT